MTGGLEPGSLHLVAAALRANADDVPMLARLLADTLGGALPDGMVEVDRDRSLADRVAGRQGSVRAVRVLVPDGVLELRTAPGPPQAEIRQVVRGVVLRRRSVGLEEFLSALAAELGAVADRDAAARSALERVLGLS